jgi:hypothetical protein
MSKIRFDEVVIDCADPRALAAFWASATGYEVTHVSDTWASIVGEGDRDICIAFQRVPEAKTSKNRVHVDLAAADEESEARRIEALGAVRRWTSDKPDDPFVVLADPEGNEFCVVRTHD